MSWSARSKILIDSSNYPNCRIAFPDKYCKSYPFVNMLVHYFYWCEVHSQTSILLHYNFLTVKVYFLIKIVKILPLLQYVLSSFELIWIARLYILIAASYFPYLESAFPDTLYKTITYIRIWWCMIRINPKNMIKNLYSFINSSIL